MTHAVASVTPARRPAAPAWHHDLIRPAGVQPDPETGLYSRLFFGTVTHKRLWGPRHRFGYRSFAMLLDLDELPELARRCRLFGHNRGFPYVFRDRDHGPRDGTALRPWIEGHARAAGLDINGGRVQLLCLPRLFGFTFNPLTVWFLHDAEGRLAGLLHEVRNTFGDKHGYLLPAHDDHSGGIAQSCDKHFFVSPFIGMQGRYRFRVEVPGARMSVLIRLSTPGPETGADGSVAPGLPRPDKDGLVETLIATWSGRTAPFTDASLRHATFSYPLMTLKVIAAIHFEALRLWRKRAVVHDHIPPPVAEVSHG